MIDFLSEAQALFEYTQSMRRDFHAHPELGFQEVRTSGIVARELNSLGLEVRTGVGGTGRGGSTRRIQTGTRLAYPCGYGCPPHP